MKLYRFLWIGMFLVAGCTASGPPYSSIPQDKLQPKEGMVRYIIYRPESFKYFLRTLDVRVNGSQVCDLKNGSFLIRDMAPWQTTISASLSHMPGRSWVRMQGEAGHTYYIKMAVDNTKFSEGLPGSGVDEETADNDRLRAAYNPAPDAGPFLVKIVDKNIAAQELLQLKLAAECE